VTATLLYVTDPMCSWCFGFAPVLAGVQAELARGVTLRMVLGGLAPDSTEPMPEELKIYIQEAWRAVEARSGVRFEWSYWERNSPRRSTWPACRAVLAAGERGPEMFAAIQHAYYREARDPSRGEVLLEVAAELGFEPTAFAERLESPEVADLLRRDFLLRDRLGASSFPSLGLERNGELALLTRGWIDPVPLREALARAGLLGTD